MSEERKTSTYYVPTLRVRRELIPVDGQEAYRCVTISASGPEPGDVVVADQVAFDDVLISMRLMAPRNPAQKLFARAWRGMAMDLLGAKPAGSEPTETLLRVIN